MVGTVSVSRGDREGAEYTRRAFDYEHANQRRSDLCDYVPQRIPELLADLGLPREWFKGKRVLDAGCGGGRWSYALAELGARVTAIDFTESGVAATAAMLAAYPDCQAFRVDLSRLGDPGHAPLEVTDGGFDLVMSWGVLHHTEQPAENFRRLVPLVAPGGYLHVMLYGPVPPIQDAVTDLVRASLRHLSPEDRYEACRAFVLNDPARAALLWPHLYVYCADPNDQVAYERVLFMAYDCYSPRWNHRHTLDQVHDWFAGAGFGDITNTHPEYRDILHVRGRRPDAPSTAALEEAEKPTAEEHVATPKRTVEIRSAGLRVALIGNTAQNAYLLAKGLRDLGVEADSFDLGGGYALQSPHWQDAVFDASSVGTEFWDWGNLPTTNGYRRQPWAKILGNDGARASYPTQEAFQADLGRILRGQKVLRARGEQQRDLTLALSRSRVPVAEREELVRAAMELPDWRSIVAIACQYDVVVLCGTFAGYGPLLPADQPYVAFEHGTMRYVPSLATGHHRLLAAAYRYADANVITNADCWEAAGQLGVRDTSVFIPHPLDVEMFSPRECADRPRLLAALGCELIFFAPARHSRSETSGSKRNDRIIHAYARYVREAEPAAAPRAGLVLASWGTPEHIAESEALVETLGLKGRVAWIPCQPKRRLLEWYRASDVVLDQFSDTVGSFGTVTAEALAVGKPVITYYNHAAHEWCENVLGEPPPVISARTADQIYDALLQLAWKPTEREWRGRDARRWVVRWHSLKRVARLHLALYRRVLEAHAEQLTAPSDATSDAVLERQPLLAEVGRTQ